MMKEYRYCAVIPQGFGRAYYYIADDDIGKVLTGTYVLVPFGNDDEIKKGGIVDVNMFTEEDAPFPVDRTKKILRVISREEYFEVDEGCGEASADEQEELAEAWSFIEAGDYEAMFDWAYDHHKCVESDVIMRMVVRLYEMCVEQHNTTAALNLGTLYYEGHGVPQDYVKAAKYYEISAAAGELRTICNLGYCWYYGRHAEVDYGKALYYFQMGANLHNDPNCLYKLGDMYYNGKGTEENRKYAWMLYLRAEEACNAGGADDFCRADIQLRIGKGYLTGAVVEPDPMKAELYLSLALLGFYSRIKTDPFVKDLINDAKLWRAKAEEMMDA